MTPLALSGMTGTGIGGLGLGGLSGMSSSSASTGGQFNINTSGRGAAGQSSELIWLALAAAAAWYLLRGK